MAHTVTCKVCKNKGKSDQMYKYLREGSSRSEYFCNEHEFILYQKQLEEKQKKLNLEKIEKQKFNELDVYIADKILGYEIGQIVPPNLKRRIKKLREHYDYDVIRYCFQLMEKQLNQFVQSGRYNNEQHMVNYIMVVIENNINDAFYYFKRKKEIESKQEVHKIDSSLFDDITHKEVPVQINRNKNDISQFLDEGDI